MKGLLSSLMVLLSLSLSGQDISGQWNGALQIQGMQLRIVFHIHFDGSKFISTLDSPDQGASAIPTDSTTFVEDSLTIYASKLRMVYKALYNASEERFTGTFTQGPMSFPLNLSKEIIEKEVKRRKQDPLDISYKQEEVVFTNPKGGHQLSGTLTLPNEGKITKAVVLVSGSGPQNRNEELQGINHRPFLVLSDYLTRNGIAVLRYDDRGVAQSTGDFQSATTADLAEDAKCALNYLRKRADMEVAQIGILGHSEGGMIAPILASEANGPDFIGLLAGPGIPIKDLMLLQTAHISRASGLSEEKIIDNNKVQKALYQTILEAQNVEKDSLVQTLENILEGHLNQLSEEELKEIGDKSDFVHNQVQSITTDWFLYFMRFNPKTYLEKVQCPVLAINGSLDAQVTAKENLEGIREALKHNPNVTIQEIEGQNHLFQKAMTGAPAEYGFIEETFNESTITLILDWIRKL